MIDPFAGFDRAAGVGGSDAAAIMGLSPHRSMMDVYLEKTRHPAWSPAKLTPALEWGRRLEAAVRDKYAQSSGRVIHRQDFPRSSGIRKDRHDGDIAYWHWNGIQYAHLDGWLDDETIFEAKTSGRPDDWAGGVPLHYVVQAQQYMAIVGALRCVVAVLISGRDYRTFELDADPAAQMWIQDQVEWFWRAVQDRTPPVDLVRAEHLFPVSVDKPPIQLPARSPEIDDLLDVRHQIVELQGREAALVEQIKLEIGDAPGLVAPGVRIDYRNTKPPSRVGWEQVTAGLANTLEMLRRYREHLPSDAARHLDPGVYDALVSLYTVTGRAARPFVVRED